MKRSKKVLALATAIAVVSSLGVTNVFAASANQKSTESISTEFTFEYKNDPTYTVTIPDTLVLSKDGAQMDIVAEDVANLDNQKISVTVEATDADFAQMYLSGKADNGQKKTVRYQIIKPDGTNIETKLSKYYITDAEGNETQIKIDTKTLNVYGKSGVILGDVELASFTENGSATLTVKPILVSSTAKGVTYSGSMTYGIQLVDAE